MTPDKEYEAFEKKYGLNLLKIEIIKDNIENLNRELFLERSNLIKQIKENEQFIIEMGTTSVWEINNVDVVTNFSTADVVIDCTDEKNIDKKRFYLEGSFRKSDSKNIGIK